jgi:signal transduction histidine kinase
MMLPTLSGLPENVRRVFRSSVNEIKQLAEQLTNRSSAGAVSMMGFVDKERVSICEILRDVIEQKRIESRFEYAASIQTAWPAYLEGTQIEINPVVLKGVLSNIINNALESYSDGERIVFVGLEGGGGTCKIEIEDHGLGMSPSVMAAIMDKRQFSTKSGSSRGIGLSQASRVVETAGGTIRFHSEAGTGCKVVIELPVASAVKHAEFSNQSPRIAPGL